MMFLFLLLFLLLPYAVADCPPGSELYSPLSTCYFFMTTPQNFSDAEQACNDLGGNLASIHDSFANSFIYNEARYIFYYVDNFTIGVSCNSGNCSWSDGSSFNYNDFFSYSSNQSGCGTMNMYNGGYWSLQNCFDKLPYVCQRAETVVTPSTPPPLCPSDEWYYFEESNSCYYWTSFSDWTTAEAFCVSQGAHLASVHSSNETKFLNLISNSDVWIGLHADDNPVGLNTTWKWTDGSYLDYLPWGGSFDLPTLGYDYQCVLARNGYILNTDCSSNNTGICKKPSSKIISTTSSPPIPKCVDGWTYYSHSKYCYLGPTPVMSQSEAENYCTSKGGHLASVHSDDELKFLLYVTSRNNSWIGLNATDNPVQINSTWQWSDGTNVDFMLWSNGIPSLDNQLCATSEYTDSMNFYPGTFKNADCLASYSGICKRSSLNNMPTSSPATTTDYFHPSPCNNVWTFSNYFIPLTRMNWTTAESYCELCGGFLTSIHSSDELKNIVNNVYDNYMLVIYQYVWIGLYSDNNGHTWKWIDGSSYDYSNWMLGYPAQGKSSCGSLQILNRNQGGMTNEKNCSEGLYYFGICKYR